VLLLWIGPIVRWAMTLKRIVTYCKQQGQL